MRKKCFKQEQPIICAFVRGFFRGMENYYADHEDEYEDPDYEDSDSDDSDSEDNSGGGRGCSRSDSGTGIDREGLKKILMGQLGTYFNASDYDKFFEE